MSNTVGWMCMLPTEPNLTFSGWSGRVSGFKLALTSNINYTFQPLRSHLPVLLDLIKNPGAIPVDIMQGLVHWKEFALELYLTQYLSSSNN